MLNWFKKNAMWHTVFLRLGLGAVFLAHGIGKLLSVGPVVMDIAAFSGCQGKVTTTGHRFAIDQWHARLRLGSLF